MCVNVCIDVCVRVNVCACIKVNLSVQISACYLCKVCVFVYALEINFLLRLFPMQASINIILDLI